MRPGEVGRRALSRTTLITAVMLGCGLATAGEAPFVWDLPPGFPPPAVPADNPMNAVKVELGRRLFYDPRLSGEGTLACAGCHRPELAFTDGRAQAEGATGERHPRSAMSLANVGYNATLTWADPNQERLEEQARIPLFNRHPVEMGASEREEDILRRLRQDPHYPMLFALSFPDQAATGEPIHFRTITYALAAFQRTLISGNAPYDRLVYHDEGDALSPQAKRGMRLFFSERLKCSQCHGGFTFSGPIVFQLEGESVAVPVVFHNTGLYNLGEGAYPETDPGLFHHTAVPEDMGRFRTPTLRNIAVTAPYMHDGSVATLDAVLDHYAAGGRSAAQGRPNPLRDHRIQGFPLSAEEKAALIAFLESLTDESFLRDPRFSDPWKDHGLGLDSSLLAPVPGGSTGARPTPPQPSSPATGAPAGKPSERANTTLTGKQGATARAERRRGPLTPQASLLAPVPGGSTGARPTTPGGGGRAPLP